MKEFQITFPNALTDEEQRLKSMQDRLRQLRRFLRLGTAPIAPREDRESQSEKRSLLAKRSAEAAINTEEVRKKIAAGAITLKRAEEQKTFKRAKPRVHRPSEGAQNSDLGSPPPTTSTFPILRRNSDDADRRVLCVRGYDLTADAVENAFKKFGEIESTTVEDRNRIAYVTFASNDRLDEAIREMDGNMIRGVTLRVSYGNPNSGTQNVRVPPPKKPEPQKRPERRPSSALKNRENPSSHKTLAASHPKKPMKFINFQPGGKIEGNVRNQSPEDGEIDEDDKTASPKTESESESTGRQMMVYGDDPFA